MSVKNIKIFRNKVFKKIITIIKILFLINLFFILIGTILHNTYFKRHFEQIKPYGHLVEVDNSKMHVYSIGNGEKTVVLLPGMGVALPSAEFSPLMRKLSNKYKVVCVEYFGVGFSGAANKPRNCQNYAEEIRMALDRAGFKPPYVLMPHSISGVYSEYYAAKYPNEVAGIISLDSTSTAYYDEMPAIVKYALPIAKFQQSTGIMSLLAPIMINKKELMSKGYTEREVEDITVFSGFSVNNTLMNQISNTTEFIKQTITLPFPSTIPYFKVISRQTYETPNNQLKITPQEYQIKHLERIGKHAKFEILDGSHFIYVNNVERISRITDDFITSNSK